MGTTEVILLAVCGLTVKTRATVLAMRNVRGLCVTFSVSYPANHIQILATVAYLMTQSSAWRIFIIQLWITIIFQWKRVLLVILTIIPCIISFIPELEPAAMYCHKQQQRIINFDLYLFIKLRKETTIYFRNHEKILFVLIWRCSH